ASPASTSATPTRSIPSATCCSAADRRPCAIAKMPATSTQYSTKGRRLSKQSSTRKRRKRKPDCTKERRRRVQLPVPDRAAGEAKSRSPHEPLPDPPPVTRAELPLNIREQTPLEPGQEHVRLYRKTRNQHDRRNDYRRRQHEQDTGAKEEEHHCCGTRESCKQNPHDERQRAQRASPQIVLERLIVL